MSRLDNRPLASQAYDLLLREIMAGARPAGERISEESIAQEFGISRTPAREALMWLAADGLVERTARKGCRIASVDRERRAELFQCRAMLEGMALDLGFDRLCRESFRELAARFRAAGDARTALEADDRLHALILEACPNRVLVELIARLQHQCWAFRAFRSVSLPPETLTRERLQIVEAILAENREEARRCLVRHIEKGEAP